MADTLTPVTDIHSDLEITEGYQKIAEEHTIEARSARCYVYVYIVLATVFAIILASGMHFWPPVCWGGLTCSILQCMFYTIKFAVHLIMGMQSLQLAQMEIAATNARREM